MGVTFAVADLHGRLDCLEGALAGIESHVRVLSAPLGGEQTIIFLGDYVDRGPASAAIIERLIAGPPPGWRWICLKGNHEEMMAVALALRDADRYEYWLTHGGDAALESYAGDRETLARHLAWIETLASFHVDPHRVFVHGGVDPAMPLEAHRDDVLLWKRYPKHQSIGHGTRHVVHGHEPDPKGSLLYAERTALDTLAWRTGRLVVGVFDDDKAGGPVDLIEVRRAAA